MIDFSSQVNQFNDRLLSFSQYDSSKMLKLTISWKGVGCERKSDDPTICGTPEILGAEESSSWHPSQLPGKQVALITHRFQHAHINMSLEVLEDMLG